MNTYLKFFGKSLFNTKMILQEDKRGPTKNGPKLGKTINKPSKFGQKIWGIFNVNQPFLRPFMFEENGIVMPGMLMAA